MTPRPLLATAALPALVLAATAMVLALSWPHGGVGPDGAAYLRAAVRLGEDGTLWDAAATPTGTARFSTWPPGYPALVSLGVMRGTDAWIASKLVGLLSLLVTAGLLLRLDPRVARVAVLALSPASVLACFAWTASEGPFLLALTVLVLALGRDSEAPGGAAALAAGLAAAVAFTMRYLGLFAVLPLLWAALDHLRGGRRAAAARLVGAAALPLATSAWILGANVQATGHLTGQPRIPAPESWARLGEALLRGVLAELVPTVRTLSSSAPELAAAGLGLALVVGAALALRAPPDAAPWRLSPMGRHAARTAGLYLGCLIVLRTTAHFDLFTWRLLAPATFLGLLAGASTLRTQGPVTVARVHVASTSVAGVALLAQLGLAVTSDRDHLTTRIATLAHYEDVPEGCVVGPHDLDMPWLRPDLVPATPAIVPYAAEPESVDAFRARLLATPHACVLLEARHDLDPRRVHPSWIPWSRDRDDGAHEVLREPSPEAHAP